jgi:hypothetical protein
MSLASALLSRPTDSLKFSISKSRPSCRSLERMSRVCARRENAAELVLVEVADWLCAAIQDPLWSLMAIRISTAMIVPCPARRT